MDRIIKFSLTNDKSVSLPMPLAEQVIDNRQQLVKIMQNRVWTGKVINKAHIINADFDIEAEDREWELNNLYPIPDKIDGYSKYPDNRDDTEKHERLKKRLDEMCKELTEKLRWDKNKKIQ